MNNDEFSIWTCIVVALMSFKDFVIFLFKKNEFLGSFIRYKFIIWDIFEFKIIWIVELKVIFVCYTCIYLIVINKCHSVNHLATMHTLRNCYDNVHVFDISISKYLLGHRHLAPTISYLIDRERIEEKHVMKFCLMN